MLLSSMVHCSTEREEEENKNPTNVYLFQSIEIRLTNVVAELCVPFKLMLLLSSWSFG